MDSKGRKITLRIADMVLPMRIKSEKEEELYRKAAKQINDKLNTYRSHFASDSVDDEAILAMVTIDFAFRTLSLEDRNDTAPFAKRLQSYNKELKELFDEEEA